MPKRVRGLLAGLIAAAVVTGVVQGDNDCAVEWLGTLAESYEFAAALQESDCADAEDASDYADIYRFRLETPATVKLEMQSKAFHALLRLERVGGSVLRTSHRTMPRGSARIAGALSVGEYELTASEQTRGRQTGVYTLRIEASPRESGAEPLFIYPDSEPSYLEPPDWIHFGRYRHTRCSGDRLEILKRDAIAVVLFNHPTLLFDRFLLAPRYIAHSYNCHAAHPEIGWSGYEQGHSGWDLQTHSVIGAKTADHVFYSLTKGVVAFSGGGYGAIVVHTDDGHTVWYQHARRIYVRAGGEVEVGTPLGVQGNVGLGYADETTAEHVHIAVREGRHKMPPPAGAFETIDPIPYFHRYLFE